MKKLISILIMMVLLANIANAGSITISSVESVPSKVEPGSQTIIDVNLRNQGDSSIKDIRIALDLGSSSLPFIPLGSAAQKIIDNIINKNDK